MADVKDGGGNNNGGGNKGDGGGGGGGKGNKNPAGVPAWSGFVPPPGMVIGGPPRPLQNPTMPALNMIPGLVPGPPPVMVSVG